jgi:hypothetical protein
VKIVRASLRETIVSELNNLKHGRVERTFNAHFAARIEEKLDLSILRADPFFNRHLGASKKLNGDLIEVDLAVHTRDTDRNNLVVIELETTNSPAGDDIWKVVGLTTELDGYGYRLGLYLVGRINR